MMIERLKIVGGIIFLFLSACAYKTLTLRTEECKTIQILPVKNKIDITSEEQRHGGIKIYPQGLENKITQALKEEFIWRQDLQVVNEGGDLLLEPYLSDFRRSPFSYVEDEPREYILGCTVKVVIRSQDGATYEEEVSEDISFFSANETYDDAERELARKVSRRIVDKIIFRW